MTKVNMDLVKQLRDKTQVGMMDCKKALEETEGDFDKACEILRKKGAAVAAKRADNVTNHGRIESFISPDFKTGALVEVACETDFSANTEAMKHFVDNVAQQVALGNPADINALMAQPLATNPQSSARHLLDELVAKICESIKVNRFVRFAVSGNGLVNAYIHPGSTVGVLIELTTDKDASAHLDALKTIAKDVCMQIAVTNPLCTQSDELDQTIIEKEREIAREQLKDSGKPAQVIDKIVEGKLNKFFQEVCLLSQGFIKNDKQTVAQYIDESSKKLGLTIKVKQFKRFAIGR